MKKRTLSLALLAAMLLASCGGSGSTSETTTASSETTTAPVTEVTDGRDKSDLPDSYDLGGYNMRVLLMTPSSNATSMATIAPDEANGEVLNDTLYDRNMAVTQKYNFTIENFYEDNVLTAVNNSVMAGDDNYDVALPYFDNAAMEVNSGHFVDLKTVENLDVTKNYWDQNFNSQTSLDNKLYFLTGDMITEDDDVMMMILYNSDLAEDLGIENLYDAVREGRWTYEMLRKYVKQVANDLDGNGRITKDDTVGYLWASNNCVAPHFAAAGQMVFTKDENDRPVLNENFERGYAVWDVLTELLDQNLYSLEWTQYGSDQVSVITGLVSNKQVLFQNMILSQVRRLYRDVTADFGLLPMPKLEESDENYVTTVWKSFQAICIPTTNSQLAKTGFVLEALAAASDKVSHAYYNICLESKYTRDAESFEMIELARQNVVYDIGFIYDWGKLYSSITNAGASNKDNIASLVASFSTAAKEAAEAFIEELK